MHVFALLADPVRRLLVETLATGEHSVAELTDMAMHDFSIGRTAVSHHLRILRDEHVVITRQDAGSRMYRLHPGAIDRIEREIAELRERWDHRFGWPYLVDPPPRPRSHRVGRAGLRGADRASNPWREPARRLIPDRAQPWLDDSIVDEGDGEHRWVAEGAVPRADDPLGF